MVTNPNPVLYKPEPDWHWSVQRNSHRKESTCLFSSDSLAYPLHTLTFLYQSDPQKAVAFIKTMNNIIQNGRKYKSIFLEKKLK